MWFIMYFMGIIAFIVLSSIVNKAVGKWNDLYIPYEFARIMCIFSWLVFIIYCICIIIYILVIIIKNAFSHPFFNEIDNIFKKWYE